MELINQSVKISKQKDFSFEGIKNFVKEYCYDHLEFAPVYLKLTGDEKLSRKYRENPYSKVILKYPEGNIPNIYCVPTHYITTNYEVIVKNSWEEDLQYLCEPTEYHARLYTVHFISNKLVISELKNIINSFIEYSTDDSLAFVIPNWCKTLHEGTKQEYSILEITPDEAIFMDYIQKTQNLYISLIDDGWTSQQASAILPVSVKTELIACGFKEDWQHLFDIYSNTKSSMTKELVDLLQEKIKEMK